MQKLVKPYSKIFLGDGRSINKGEIFFGGGNFFINPLPFFSTFGKIKKIFLYGKKTILIPMPKDVFFYKEKEERKYKVGLYKIKIKEKKVYLKIDLEKKQKLKDINAFLDETKLKEYLKGNLVKTSMYYKYEELIQNQIIPNIEINKSTKTVKERMLTFKLSNEFDEFNKQVGIFLEIEDEINDKYYLLGGRNSIILTKDIKEQILEKINIKEIKSKIKANKSQKGNIYFKIILLTPTNYPPEIEGTKKIAQITGKPIAFSGWFNVYDKDKKIDSFPSILFKLIPAGSVFYYKLEDESKLDKIFEEYWLKPKFFVPEYPYFEKSEDGTNPLGFGLSIIGVANIEEY